MASFKELMQKRKASSVATPGERSAPSPGKIIVPQAEAEATPHRMLGEEVPEVPYVFLSKTDSEQERLKKKALLADATCLGIWTEREDAEYGWIALQLPGNDPHLLLLHRLPLLSRARPGEPY